MKLGHLNALRALEAAVRLGSFRAAGAEFGVTAAAVGQQVRKLEEAIGQPLLLRRPNGFEPTALAAQVAERLATGFEALQDAMLLMRRRGAKPRLAITAAPSMAEWWLAPRLAGFLVSHSEIDLRIDSTVQLLDRGDTEFDFALRYAPPSAGADSGLVLFHEWLVPVCVPELLARMQPDDSANPFGDVPLLQVDSETGDSQWVDWRGWGRRFGVTLPGGREGLKFTRTTLALQSLYSGHGLHLAQLSIALPDIVSGRLVAPFGPARCVRTGYPYRLVTLGKPTASGLHEDFVGWITSEANRTLDAMRSFLG